MIYGVAGASGTGKSTLCQHVSEALAIPFVKTSITDMARKAGFEAVGRLGLEDRIRLQNSLLEQFEELLDKTRGPVIFDRTPIDLIGYLGAEIHMHSRDLVDVETLEAVDGYFKKCQEMTAARFDRIFVTNVLPHYETAETRPGYNPAYQRHVQFLIMGAVVASPGPLMASFLLMNDLHQRVRTVTDQIAERLDTIETEKRKNRQLH